MDQSHVTQRQQPKRGKDKESAADQHTKTESGSSSGDTPTAEAAYLPGFSAEQAQSLTTFISDALDNAISPLQGHLTKELANQNARMDQMQAMLEKIVAFGEKPAQQTSSLPVFPTGTPLNPQPTPQVTPSKFKPAKQPGSDSHKPNPAQEPIFGGAPTQLSFPARSQFARWRPEELGTFDPDQDDLYSFVHRIREVADLRDLRTVQLNISLQLRGKAKQWFELELTHADHSALYDPANGIEEWIDRLVTRFKPSATLLLQQLHETSYTRSDAAANKDPEEYVHKIMKLTRTRPLDKSLMEAYLRFESGLQVNLIPPTQQTTIAEFMDQIKAKKGAWFRNYSGFRKKDDNLANQTQASRSNGQQRGYQSGYQPGYRQQQWNQQRQVQGSENSQQNAPKIDSNQPRYSPYPTKPAAYHQTVLSPEELFDQCDEDDDYEVVE